MYYVLSFFPLAGRISVRLSDMIQVSDANEENNSKRSTHMSVALNPYQLFN